MADFSQRREALDALFCNLGTPPVSETNLYDAVIYATEQMRSVTGRRAIVLVTSGVDTFSKASLQDALTAVQNGGCPIYAISLSPALREFIRINGGPEALKNIDWDKADHDLQQIAQLSGARAYFPRSTIDLSPIYDDILENLKLRYVITYRSSTDTNPNTPRTVRVELVDPKTGGPLRIVDQSGRTIQAHISVRDSYVPSGAAAAGNGN